MPLGYTNTPLVFGLSCPKCGAEHYLTAMGVVVQTIEGETQPMRPTLSLRHIEVNPETGIGTIVALCGVCERDFQMIFGILRDDVEEVFH